MFVYRLTKDMYRYKYYIHISKLDVHIRYAFHAALVSIELHCQTDLAKGGRITAAQRRPFAQDRTAHEKDRTAHEPSSVLEAESPRRARTTSLVPFLTATSPLDTAAAPLLLLSAFASISTIAQLLHTCGVCSLSQRHEST